MGRSDFPEGETVPHREVISKEKEERRKGGRKVVVSWYLLRAGKR